MLHLDHKLLHSLGHFLPLLFLIEKPRTTSLPLGLDDGVSPLAAKLDINRILCQRDNAPRGEVVCIDRDVDASFIFFLTDLASPQDLRNGEEQVLLGEVLTGADAAAGAKHEELVARADALFVQAVVRKPALPALGLEVARQRVDGRVVVHVPGVDDEGRVGRDGVGSVGEIASRRVRKAEGRDAGPAVELLDDLPDVGEVGGIGVRGDPIWTNDTVQLFLKWRCQQGKMEVLVFGGYLRELCVGLQGRGP